MTYKRKRLEIIDNIFKNCKQQGRQVVVKKFTVTYEGKQHTFPCISVLA